MGLLIRKDVVKMAEFYNISVTETLHRDFTLQADTLEEALSIAKGMWRHQVIGLDNQDLEQARIVAETEDGDFKEWLYD